MSVKAETVGQAAGGVGAIVAGMTITEVIPWVLGVVLVLLSIAVQIVSYQAKKAEKRLHDEEFKRLRAEDELRRIKDDDEG